MTLGDERWEQSHGRVNAIERWQYALAAVRARLRILARSVRGEARPQALALDRISLDRIVYPDSAWAKLATDKLSTVVSPAIANHSLRTYVWGSLLGQIDGRTWDEELLYVTSMLHDLGLSEALHGSAPCAQCFTLDAVQGARDVFAHAESERSERVRRAVLVHLNMDVPGEVYGWEAHYMRAGALLDALGERYGELSRDAIDTVLLRYPRLNFKEEIIAWQQRESQLRPHSRLAILGRLGLNGLLRRAPFAT